MFTSCAAQLLLLTFIPYLPTFYLKYLRELIGIETLFRLVSYKYFTGEWL